jgi:hypothetical protein
MLTVWDRLRGTLISAEPAAHQFGVPGELDSYPQDWLRQLVEPLGVLRLRTASRVPAVVDAGTVRSSG